MTPEESARIAAMEQDVKSHNRRLDTLERHDEALQKLATSVEVMATKLGTVDEKVDTLTKKVTDIESEPASKWKTLVTAIISAFAGGIATAIITMLMK